MTPDIDATVRDAPDRNRYEIATGGETVGVLDYRLGDSEIAFVHAEVDPAHGGQGLGSTLAREALDDARRRDLKVRPLCPFVADYVTRHPDEYGDLIV